MGVGGQAQPYTEIQNRDGATREMLTAKKNLFFLSKAASQFSQDPQPICPKRTEVNLELFLFFPAFFFFQTQRLSFRNRTIRETLITGIATGKWNLEGLAFLSCCKSKNTQSELSLRPFTVPAPPNVSTACLVKQHLPYRILNFAAERVLISRRAAQVFAVLS